MQETINNLKAKQLEEFEKKFVIEEEISPNDPYTCKKIKSYLSQCQDELIEAVGKAFVGKKRDTQLKQAKVFSSESGKVLSNRDQVAEGYNQRISEEQELLKALSKK